MPITSIIAQSDDEGARVPLARLRENLIDLDAAIADTGIDEDDGARLAELHAQWASTSTRWPTASCAR